MICTVNVNKLQLWKLERENIFYLDNGWKCRIIKISKSLGLEDFDNSDNLIDVEMYMEHNGVGSNHIFYFNDRH